MAVPEWTAPTTFVVGHIETADELNVVLRDNMNFLHAAKAAIVFLDAAPQSITTGGSGTAVLFDGETYDPWGTHSTSSNTSRLTVPASMAGVLRVTGHVQWEASATSYRVLSIRKNGTTTVAEVTQDAPAADEMAMSITALVVLATNDYVELMVQHFAGGTLDVNNGAELTALSMEFIGAQAVA